MILGRRPHRASDLRPLDQQLQPDDEHNHNAHDDQLEERDLRVFHLNGLFKERRHRPVFGPPHDHHRLFENDRHADGDEQRRHVPHVAHRPEGDLLHQNAENPPRRHPHHQGHRPREIPECQGEVSHKRPDHVDLPVGEGDQVHGAENDDEAERR